MTLEQLSVVIALAGVLIAFAVYISNGRKDAGKQESAFSQINTKLDFLTDDIKDLKASERLQAQELQAAKEIANHALERAEAAHSRLDRAGLDTIERGAVS